MAKKEPKPKKKRKFIVARSYVTRMRWTVEARSKADALKKLDDISETPDSACEEEWQGPFWGVAQDQTDDFVEEIK